MKRKLAFLLIVATMLFTLAGCGGGTAANESAATENSAASESESAASAEATTISVGVPTAPPALPVLHMIEDNLLGEDVTIELATWNAPEELLAMVQGGEHDLYAFPLTVVSTLYNKGMDVRLMNVNTWGVTYFMTTDPDFTSWSDLAGKTVYVPLQSSPPDALTQYATLIEPQVTSAMKQNSDVRRALSFEDEWQRVTGTDTMIPNAGFGTTQRFLDENPELAAEFQAAYEESVQWVLDNPAEAAALAEKYLDMNATVVEAAIPTMGLTFKSAEDAKPELDDFYQLLYDFDPSMIGGELPDEGMFYAG